MTSTKPLPAAIQSASQFIAKSQAARQAAKQQVQSVPDHVMARCESQGDQKQMKG